MMIIAPNSRAHKRKKERGKVKREYGGVCGEEEGNADCGGMAQPSQQHVAPCVKVVEWGFDKRIILCLITNKRKFSSSVYRNLYGKQGK